MTIEQEQPSLAWRIRRALWRTLRKVGRRTRRALVGEPAAPEPLGFDLGEKIPAEVIVYFPDLTSKIYQLIQWLPVLEELDRHHRVLIVTRRKRSFLRLDEHTSLRKVYVPYFAQLCDLYMNNDFKVALYVNNGMRNFQSLAHQPLRHVHINHGECDKISMASNQAKAYDRVFVAGDAARRRHRLALLDFDESKLVPIGRPQLDFVAEPTLEPSDRRTVLYAPTWEGENEANNYTSVDVYGPAIIEAVLRQPDVRLIYKPHPRVPRSHDEGVRASHDRIVELMEAAQLADPGAGHLIMLTGDILGLLPVCDAMVADVSSVGLDFLYLNTAKPLFLADRRSDAELLANEAPVSACTYPVNAATIAGLGDQLEKVLSGDDSKRDEREQMRGFYFGEGSVGASTKRFIDSVGALIEERDMLIARQIASGYTHSSGPSEDGDEREDGDD